MKSRRKARYDAEFEAMRPVVVARAQGKCESLAVVQRRDPRLAVSFLLMRGEHCRVMGSEIHHRKPRSRGGTNALDNLCYLCLWCHTWVHAHPTMAGGIGLLLHANESEDLWTSMT